jgi:hypothetical protein
MIHRIAIGAQAIVALIVLSACDGSGSPVPTAPAASSTVSRRRGSVLLEVVTSNGRTSRDQCVPGLPRQCR